MRRKNSEDSFNNSYEQRTPSNIRKAKITSDKHIDKMDLGKIQRKSGLKSKRRRSGGKMILLIPAILIIFTLIFILINGNDDMLDDSSVNISSAEKSSAPFSYSSSTSLSSESSSAVSKIDSDERINAYTTLQSNLDEYINEFDGRIGIYYINLNNGETYGYSENEPFVAASSIKMAILTELYKKVAEGIIDLNDELAYDSRPYPTGDYEAGTGIIAQEANGTVFSVRRTAQLAITISDNCATNMIIRVLGGIDEIISSLNNISSQVPYRETVSYKNYSGVLETGKHRSSAIDLAKYAEDLYRHWVADKETFDPLIEDLKDTIFNFGIHTDLPVDIPVAHKIGTNNAYRAENDVGIIFADEPYVLCVMTETEYQETGRRALSEISLVFYEYITELYND